MPLRPVSDLVGRDAEVRRAQEALGGTGGAGALLVAGDAGIGKTALVRRLASLADGDLVLAGHCVGDVGSLPYLPFVEMLAHLDAADRDLLDDLVAEHPGLLPLVPRLAATAPADAARGDLVEAVLAGLGRLGARGPVLVVVEDVHWADESTRELLTLLFTRGVPDGVRLVATYRSDDVHRRHPLAASLAVWTRLPGLARLELAPLGEADVRRLVRSVDAGLDADLVDAVARRAEGNAFFAEELAAAAGAGPGADLTRILLARVDRLEEEAQAVVRVAAVVGRRVPHALLERVAGVDAATLRRAVRSAVEHHVLEPWGDRGYEFRHALLAEAVSEDLLPTERLQLHRACVEALQDDEELGTAADLARHALAAGDRMTALAASVRAGDTARRMGGPADALAHYEAGLGLAGADGAEAHDLTLRAAAAAIGAGRALRAVALVRSRLEHPDAVGVRRAELLTTLVFAARLTEERVDPLARTAEALDLVGDDGPVRLRVAALTRRAEALVDARRPAEALELAERAMSLAVDDHLLADRVDLAGVLARLSEEAGDPGASIRRLRGVVEGWTETPDLALLRAQHILASVHYRQSDLPAALAAYERTAVEARRAGLASSPYGVDGVSMGTTVAYELGEWDHALALAEASRLDSLPEGATASVEAAAGLVRAARGEPDVDALLAASRPWWPEDSRIAVQVGTAAIETHGRLGRTDRMLEVLGDVVDWLRGTWDRRRAAVEVRWAALAVGYLGDALRVAPAGERGGLRDAAERLVVAAHEVWGPGSSLPAPTAEGRMWLARLAAERLRTLRAAGDDVPVADLVAAWREAERTAVEHGDAYELARVRGRLAEVLSTTGDPAAGAVLEAARGTAEALGATHLLATLERLRPRRSGDGGLTPRETEVLALLARGRTNGEIGRALFVSTKTASVHVSNILAKLGAAGRGEAVALARSRGLLGDEA